MISFINLQFKKIELYFLPLAAFFLLISTAALNFFIVLSVCFALLRIIYENESVISSFSPEIALSKISKKFMLYGVLIFFFLILSSYYTVASFENIFITLKKYIKFLYIPILFYYIKIHKNQFLIVKFFLAGSMVVLFLSYLKFFNIVNFNTLYNYFDMNLFMTLNKASVFQTSIVHGAVFSFIFYLSIYMAKKSKNNLLYVFSLLCFINVVYMNDSRNSYIISFFLILLVIYFYFNHKKYMVTTVSLFFIFSLSISPISETFNQTVVDTKDDLSLLINKDFSSSIGLRSIWAINGLNNVTEEPLFGNGVGSYEYTINKFIEKNEINVDKKLAVSNNPHNEFISISSQLGLFGLMLYILFLVSLYKDSKNKFLASGVFVIILVSSFFNSALYDNVFGLFIVMMLSLVYQKEFNE